MARWFCYYLIFFIFLFNNINMKILIDPNNFFKRYIDSTNEHHYQIQQQTEDSPIHIPYQYQTLPPAEFLRSHWIELYNELHKNNET